MMARYLVGMAVVAAGFSGAAVGPAPAAPVPRAKPEPFLPTAVGTRWTTGDPSNPDRSEDTTHTVTAAEQTKDGLLVTVAHRHQHDMAKRFIIPGKEGVPDIWVRESATRYRVAADGVYTVAEYDQKVGKWVPLDRPYCRIKLPAVPGTEWTSENADGSYKVVKTVVGAERVAVPGGTFDAVRVRSRCIEKTGRVLVRSDWLAPGVGQIKYQSEDPPADGPGLVLQSFTPARK